MSSVHTPCTHGHLVFCSVPAAVVHFVSGDAQVQTVHDFRRREAIFGIQESPYLELWEAMAVRSRVHAVLMM